MKRTIYAISFALLLFSCSPEQEEQDLNIDLTQIVNPSTVKATASLDNKSNGLYKGVFVANDGSNHGFLTINAGNDTQFNAILEVHSGKKVGFIGSVNVNNKQMIDYRSTNAFFTLDLTRDNDPVITSAKIEGLVAQAFVIKEHSTNRVSGTLGAFVDDTDASFSGTWDLISTSTRVIDITIPGVPPQSVTVNNIDTVVVCRDGGIMHSDSSMEDINPSAGCIAQGFPAGTQQPFYSGEQTISVTIPPLPFPVPVDIDEYFVPLQTSQLGGATATWSFAFSLANSNVYYDTDCNVVTSGSFSYNGKTGSITKL